MDGYGGFKIALIDVMELGLFPNTANISMYVMSTMNMDVIFRTTIGRWDT